MLISRKNIRQNVRLSLLSVNRQRVKYFFLNYSIVLLQGCQPYMIKPLSRADLMKSSTQGLQTPTCIKYKCTNPTFKEDKPVFHKSIQYVVVS